MIVSQEFFSSNISGNQPINWSVSPIKSNLVSQCGALFLFGGFDIFGQGTSISKIFVNLPPHWSIQIYFLFMKIDSWSDSSVYIYIDNQLKLKQKPFIDFYSLSSSCGTNDIDNEMFFLINTTHSNSNLLVNITTDLDGDASWKSWGITRFIFSLDKCYILCKTCFNSGKYNCLSCYPGSTLQATNECICNIGLYFYINQCLDHCPERFYGDSVDNFCKPCNIMCEKCFGPQSNQCLSCPIGTYLYNNSCVSACPSNWFHDIEQRICLINCSIAYKYNNYSDYTCGICDNNCETCIGPMINQCLSCNHSQNLIFFDFYCLRNCTDSNQSLFILNNNVSCLNECPDGFFSNLNSSLKICQNCNHKCEKCYGPTTNECFSCVFPFYYYNFSCLSECPFNTYYSENICLGNY